MDSKRLKFVLIGVGIMASMSFLMVVGMSGSGGYVYYLSVSEFLAAPPGDTDFRVNGKVTEGSIVRQASGQDVTFVMNDGTSSLAVRYHGIIPDTFVDRADVVVEGQLLDNDVFEAHTLLAKCPSKYEAADTAEEGAPAGEDKSELDREIDRIEKENQRKLDEWNENRDKAVAKVRELNGRFADWYYVVSEDVYKQIRLSRGDLIRETEKAAEEGFGVDAFRKLEKDGLDKTDEPPAAPGPGLPGLPGLVRLLGLPWLLHLLRTSWASQLSDILRPYRLLGLLWPFRLLGTLGLLQLLGLPDAYYC